MKEIARQLLPGGGPSCREAQEQGDKAWECCCGLTRSAIERPGRFVDPDASPCRCRHPVRALHWPTAALHRDRALETLSYAIRHAAHAGMVEDCEQRRGSNLQISRCTAAIRSGKWSGKGLAWAYNNRAIPKDVSVRRGWP